MKKATHKQTKTHNTHLVLKTIYDRGDVSRADIARATHLTRPTVSSIVSDLMADNLVIENGQGPSAGGKPPTLLAIAHDAYQLLCLDLSSRAFRGALINLRGEIEDFVSHPVDGRQGKDALNLLDQTIDQLRARATMPVLGIGIGAPGLINPRTGYVHQAVNLGWTELPLRERLARRTDKPTYVANDSQLAALAEFTYSPLDPGSNLILIKIGQGIGAGIILNGEIVVGDGYGAGEIGHLVVEPHGPSCRCGNHGCLEAIASTRAILKSGRAAMRRPDADWEDITTAYHFCQPDVTRAVDAAGAALGVAIASLIATFNIHHIRLAGRTTYFGDLFLRAVRKEAAARVLPAMAAATHLDDSQLGSDIVLLGASALVLKKELGVV